MIRNTNIWFRSRILKRDINCEKNEKKKKKKKKIKN